MKPFEILGIPDSADSESVDAAGKALRQRFIADKRAGRLTKAESDRSLETIENAVTAAKRIVAERLLREKRDRKPFEILGIPVYSEPQAVDTAASTLRERLRADERAGRLTKPATDRSIQTIDSAATAAKDIMSDRRLAETGHLPALPSTVTSPVVGTSKRNHGIIRGSMACLLLLMIAAVADVASTPNSDHLSSRNPAEPVDVSYSNEDSGLSAGGSYGSASRPGSIGDSYASSGGSDAATEQACRHFRNVSSDGASGILSYTEMREKFKEVQQKARLGGSGVSRAATQMLSAATSGSTSELAAAILDMGAACSRAGY